MPQRRVVAVVGRPDGISLTRSEPAGTMLESLELKEKKEKDRLEAKAAREAAKHRCFASVGYPSSSSNDGARRAAFARLDDALLARDKTDDAEEKQKAQVKVPPWEEKVPTCFTEQKKDNREAERLAREAKRREDERKRKERELNRGGRETLEQRQAKNTQLEVYRECVRGATEWHAAADALRLLLKSDATRAALEDGHRLYPRPRGTRTFERTTPAGAPGLASRGRHQAVQRCKNQPRRCSSFGTRRLAGTESPRPGRCGNAFRCR